MAARYATHCVDEDAEGLQDRTVEALDQAVRLGVESCGHAELDLSSLREGSPEPACEARSWSETIFLDHPCLQMTWS
eukprot:2819471-Rhodomonas_salina.2